MDAKRIIAIIFSFVVFATACSSAAKRDQSTNGSGTGDGGFYGPQAAAQAAATPTPTPQPSYGPELPHVKAIVLVLGPGLARTFAAAGFLKVLEENKIPVAAIYGTEMSALVSALYGYSKSKNDYEWALQKLKPEVFTFRPPAFSFSKLIGSGRPVSDLEKAIDRVLADKKLEDSKVPLRIGVFSEGGGHPMIIEHGAASAAVAGAIASAETYEPLPVDGQAIRSCNFECSFLVKEAKASGLGPVVVIDVVSDQPTHFSDLDSSFSSKVLRSARELEEQKNGADLVVHPEVKNIGYFDFAKKSTAAFAGAKAAKSVLPKLQEMVAEPQK